MDRIKKYIPHIGLGIFGTAWLAIQFLLDLPGRIDTLAKSPTYLRMVWAWIYDYRLLVNSVLFLLILWSVVWIERRRSSRLYITAPQVQALVGQAKTDIEQACSRLYPTSVQVQTIASQVRSDLERSLESTDQNLAAVALLEYLDLNRPSLDKKIASYVAAWREFDGWARDPATDWTRHEGGSHFGYVHGRTKLCTNLFTSINEEARVLFEYRWDLAPQYKATQIIPDALHIPDQAERDAYKRAWLDNEQTMFRIKQLQDHLDNQTARALAQIKGQVIPLK